MFQTVVPEIYTSLTYSLGLVKHVLIHVPSVLRTCNVWLNVIGKAGLLLQGTASESLLLVWLKTSTTIRDSASMAVLLVLFALLHLKNVLTVIKAVLNVTGLLLSIALHVHPDSF